MRAIEDTNDRLLLEGASPLFRPFFLGGVGLLALGLGLLIAGRILGRDVGGSDPGEAPVIPIAGIGVFLVTFGSFIAIVPLVGKMPYRKQILVDRSSGRLIRRDRTLVRLRQEDYPLGGVAGVDVEELRHVDGDAYYVLVLRLASGELVTLDRFTDRDAAGAVARLIREHLPPESSHPRPEDR